jgi:transposase
MSMGKRGERQSQMWVSHKDVAGGPGHRFYDKLNELLTERGFDRDVEALCAPHYAESKGPGRPSIPPGIYFRMLLVGYFEGIESERGIAWRCADSLSLKRFLGLNVTDATPDHSSLSRIRARLSKEVYEQVFRLVLGVVESRGLLRGKVVGVDSTYLRADASMRNIVRRDNGVSYQEYLKELAKAEAIKKPTAEDCRRMDKRRKGKKTSNKEWESSTDPDARITRLKDGRTRLAYKPEHVVDLDTGAIVAAEMHAADVADAASLPVSLETARENVLATVGRADADAKRDDDDDPPSGTSAAEESTTAKVEVVADKGYHKAETIRDLGDAGFRTYIPERKQKTRRRWGDKGGTATAKAFHANRARVAGEKSKALHRRRGELLERTFAHICETGAHRRTRLRGIENVHKRYLLQAAAANLGLVMRTAFGYGTPRELAARVRAVIVLLLAMALWPARYIARVFTGVLEFLAGVGAELTPTRRLSGAGSSTGC